MDLICGRYCNSKSSLLRQNVKILLICLNLALKAQESHKVQKNVLLTRGYHAWESIHCLFSQPQSIVYRPLAVPCPRRVLAVALSGEPLQTLNRTIGLVRFSVQWTIAILVVVSSAMPVTHDVTKHGTPCYRAFFNKFLAI